MNKWTRLILASKFTIRKIKNSNSKQYIYYITASVKGINKQIYEGEMDWTGPNNILHTRIMRWEFTPLAFRTGPKPACT